MLTIRYGQLQYKWNFEIYIFEVTVIQKRRKKKKKKKEIELH